MMITTAFFLYASFACPKQEYDESNITTIQRDSPSLPMRDTLSDVSTTDDEEFSMIHQKSDRVKSLNVETFESHVQNIDVRDIYWSQQAVRYCHDDDCRYNTLSNLEQALTDRSFLKSLPKMKVVPNKKSERFYVYDGNRRLLLWKLACSMNEDQCTAEVDVTSIYAMDKGISKTPQSTYIVKTYFDVTDGKVIKLRGAPDNFEMILLNRQKEANTNQGIPEFLRLGQLESEKEAQRRKIEELRIQRLTRAQRKEEKREFRNQRKMMQEDVDEDVELEFDLFN